MAWPVDAVRGADAQKVPHSPSPAKEYPRNLCNEDQVIAVHTAYHQSYVTNPQDRIHGT